MHLHTCIHRAHADMYMHMCIHHTHTCIYVHCTHTCSHPYITHMYTTHTHAHGHAHMHPRCVYKEERTTVLVFTFHLETSPLSTALCTRLAGPQAPESSPSPSAIFLQECWDYGFAQLSRALTSRKGI